MNLAIHEAVASTWHTIKVGRRRFRVQSIFLSGAFWTNRGLTFPHARGLSTYNKDFGHVIVLLDRAEPKGEVTIIVI